MSKRFLMTKLVQRALREVRKQRELATRTKSLDNEDSSYAQSTAAHLERLSSSLSFKVGLGFSGHRLRIQ